MTGSLYALRPKDAWGFMKRQPASFWLLCAYVFIEYVRPQSIYPAIDVLPFGVLSLTLTAVAVFADGTGLRVRNPLNGWIVAYLGVAVLSLATAWSRGWGIANLSVLGSWVLVYFLVTNIVTTEGRFILFMLGFLLWNFKMSQHSALAWARSGFSYTLNGIGGGLGWFHNAGEFGIEMCVFFPIALFFVIGLRRHWGRWKTLFFAAMPVTAVAGMIASASRGALLGGVVTALWHLGRTRHRVRAFALLAVAAVVVSYTMPPQMKARFEASGDDGTSQMRIQYWKDGIEITKAHPVLGIGYFGWIPYYRTFYNARGELPHNIFIQCASELGLTGLAVLLGLIGTSFVVNGRTRRLVRRLPPDRPFIGAMTHGLDGAMIGFLVSGSFVTVLYYPYLWVNVAMTAALHEVARRVAREHEAGGHAGGPPVAERPRWRPAQMRALAAATVAAPPLPPSRSA